MKDEIKNYGAFLDRIIEKYTATPKCDPELINYSLRPTRREAHSDQLSQVEWRTRRSTRVVQPLMAP